jgi:hypothetical protein
MGTGQRNPMRQEEGAGATCITCACARWKGAAYDTGDPAQEEEAPVRSSPEQVESMATSLRPRC